MKELVEKEIESLSNEAEKLYKEVAILEKQYSDIGKSLDLNKENLLKISGQIFALTRVVKTIEEQGKQKEPDKTE